MTYLHNDLDTRWERAWQLRRSDANAALEAALLLRLEVDADRRASADRRARALLLEGSCRWRLSEYGEALRLLHDALELLPETSLGARAATLQDLGTVHIYLAQHDEAFARLLAALELYDALDDEQGRSDVENNLGIVAYHRGDLIEAERAYRSALSRREQLGDRDGVAACSNNLGKVLTDRGRYDDALATLHHAATVWEALGNLRGWAMALTNIGIIHQARNELEAAAAYHCRALEVKLEVGDDLGWCETATFLGQVRARERRYEEALELLHRAASEAEGLGGSGELADACLALSELYEAFGDHAGALVWFRRYHRAERRRFDEGATQRLQALQVAYQLQRAERESLTDGLTGLANRRALDRALQDAFRTARRDGLDLAVALLDLDDFKRVNDTFGHAVGDEVLRRTAGILRHHTRATDLTARYGGEEFVVAFPDTSLADALVAAEQLCRRIREVDWSQLQPDLMVTVSIGVAEATGTTDVAELLEAADHSLYQAKHDGKDRVAS